VYLRSRTPRLRSAPVQDLIIASRYGAAYRAARRLALTAGQSLTAGPTSEFVAVYADGGKFTAAVRVNVRARMHPVSVTTTNGRGLNPAARRVGVVG
jgi:hypothetical protein